MQASVGVVLKQQTEDQLKVNEEYLSCVMTSCSNDTSHCGPQPKENTYLFLLITLGIFLIGMVLCLWIFNREVWQPWQSVVSKRNTFFKRWSQASNLQTA